MRVSRVVIPILVLFTLSAFAAAFTMPFQLESQMNFSPNLTAFDSNNALFTKMTNNNPAIIQTIGTNDMLFTFPVMRTNGLHKDYLSNLLTIGLQNPPIINQPNNQNIASQTPKTTSHQTTTATPIPALAPTATPEPVSSQPLPSAGPNTYYNSDNGRTVTINNGDIMHLRLGEGQAVGKWNINTTDGLQIVGNTFYADPIPPHPAGTYPVNDGAGTRVLDIKAIRPGVQKIYATYRNPISNEIYQNYELTVNVV